MDTVYQRSAFGWIPIDRSTALVSPPAATQPIAVPRQMAEILLSCSDFATIDEHTARICRELHLPPQSHGEVVLALREAADRQLLISRADVLARARAHARPGAPPRIASLAVVTRDRPEALVRCLRSYCENLRRHGRQGRVTVVDSSPPARAGRVQDALARLGKELAMSFRCIGLPDKAALARTLASATGVDAPLVEFALLGGRDQAHDVGANRNAVLLTHAGAPVLCTDDDMVCDLRERPGTGDDLALTGEDLPPPVTLHPSLAAARESLTPHAGSVFDVHERCLGRSVADLLSELPDERVRLGPLGPRLLTGLLRGSAQVVASFGGYYGDAGARYPAFFLWSDPKTRDQLLGGPEPYRALVTSRQIVRAAPALSVSDGRFSMCGNVALDGRETLPPFFPNLRGEDVGFGRLLRACFEDALFAHLPQAVGHLPWPDRGPFPHLWDPTPGFQMMNVLGQVLELAEGSARVAAPGERRLRLVGRCVLELARLPAADLEELLRERVTVLAARSIARSARLLEQAQGEPAYWAADLQRHIDHQREVLANPDRGVPLELLAGRGPREALELLRQQLQSYGGLLEAWPELLSAARRLEPPA